jgi:hypothetical protein
MYWPAAVIAKLQHSTAEAMVRIIGLPHSGHWCAADWGAELQAAIDAAHRHGLKIAGHLCSVTYPEAAAMGIDDQSVLRR